VSTPPVLLVETRLGIATVDVEAGELLELEPGPPLAHPAVDGIDLPLLVAADAHGSTVVAVVDRRPPLVVSNDGGLTWREAGGGLGRGVSVAISPDHPDLIVFATAERLHVSRDGGRFWTALQVELLSITAVAFRS
jgi:hypothetical protein